MPKRINNVWVSKPIPTIPQRILAVRPATKSLGVAVMEKTALLFYGVHNIKRRQSQGETMMLRLHRIRTHLIDAITLYRPMVMVVEEIPSRRLRHAPILSVMLAEIVQLAHTYEIPLKRVATETMLSVLADLYQRGALQKKELAAALAERYPLLSHHLAPFPSPQWKYWQPVVEAIGLGLTFFLQAEQAL